MSRNVQATALLAQRSVLTRLARWTISLIVLLSLVAPTVRFAPAVAASASGIVISEFRFGGPSGGNDEYVEIFNASSSDVTITGWKLQGCATGSGAASDRATISTPITLAAGQHYLFANSSTNGGYSGSVAADVTYATGISDSGMSGARIITDTGTVVDGVGRAGSTCAEGTALSTVGVSQQQGFPRKNGGCLDTNDNANDFDAATAADPQNFASTAMPCGGPTGLSGVGTATPAAVDPGDTTLLTVAVTPGTTPTSTGITVTGDLSAIGGSATQEFFDDGATGGDLTADDNIFSFDATVDAGTSAGLKNLPATIADAETRTSSAAIGLVVLGERVRIHDIQGNGLISPLEGDFLTNVQGIVVATRSNGFYLQEPDAEFDADPNTSEGIFVFTDASPGVSVGDGVVVTGTVVEFRPGGSGGANNLTTTEISNPGRSVSRLSSGNPLPTPITIAPPTASIASAIFYYEILEGMRVQIDNAVVVGPTNEFGEIPVLANGGSGSGTRTARGGIVIQPDDFNPERVILDDAIIGNANMPKVSVGTTFPGAVIGVLDYDFGNFKFLVTTNPVAINTIGTVTKETTPITVGANQFTVATFNVENLDPGDGAAKFNALARIIVNNLLAPDIVAVEEVQDNNGATNDGIVDADATLNTLIAAIRATNGNTGPTYQFRQISPVDDQDGGEPGGNIRVGFLFRTDRGVSFVDRPGGGATSAVSLVDGANGPELSLSPGRIAPTDPAFNSSRKPLAGEFSYNGQKLFVIANHFNSKGGDYPLFGQNQPPVLSSEVQRLQQATIVRDFVDELLAADANANIVVLGDLNDFQFSQPLTILEGDDPTRLHTLIETLPLNEQYSYVFDGNSQSLDHILVSPSLFTNAQVAYDIVHVNAEFSPQDSDHDPQVARFTLAPAPPTAADVSVTVAEDTARTILLQGTAGGSGTLVYSIVNGPVNGTLGVVNGNQVVYTPNADYTGPDLFTYKVTENGVDSNTATVTLTVSTTNDPPVAGNVTVTTPAGSAVAITLTATDPEGAPLTYTIIAPPAHGTLGAIVGNQITYTPTAGYSGPDTFTFRANDGVNNSNVATVSITVVAPPPPPPTFALTVTMTGDGTVTPGSGQRTAGSTVTLTATPNAGSTFIGWTVDNAPAGLENPLTITMGSAHTVAAAFATTPNFSDIAGTPYEDAIRTLAAYGAIFGYEDGSFGPDNEISRAEMAALIVRAMNWDGEAHSNPFNDRGGLNEEMWRSVGTLAWYGVAFGYDGGAFGPNDDAQYLQSISFITRAMIAKGYWGKAQADDPTIYPNVPADSPHRLDLVTFVQNAGPLPGFANTTSSASLQEPAKRGWYAAALLQALESQFGTTP